MNAYILALQIITTYGVDGQVQQSVVSPETGTVTTYGSYNYAGKGREAARKVQGGGLQYQQNYTPPRWESGRWRWDAYKGSGSTYGYSD